MAQSAVGQGSAYAFTAHDAQGRYLDGGKTYSVTLPAPIPAKEFWSFVVYSGQQRGLLETDQKSAGVDSLSPDLKANPDGSYTVWFAPTAPTGKEGNWVQTMPGKGWNALLRLYGPIHSRKAVPDDPANPLISLLRLSGIIRVSQGLLDVRNRIYRHVFDRGWVAANLPGAEQSIRFFDQDDLAASRADSRPLRRRDRERRGVARVPRTDAVGPLLPGSDRSRLHHGQPRPRPRDGLQLDGGLRYAAAQWRAELHAYQYDFEDLIERYQTGPDLFFFRNRGEARIRGDELELHAELPGGWNASLSGHVVRGRTLDDETDLDDVPPETVTLQVTKSFGERGFVQARGALYASDDRPGPTEQAREGYGLVDVSGGWRIVRSGAV